MNRKTAMQPGVHQSNIHNQPHGGRRAVVLVGHGSVRAGSGAAMFRLAERARAAGMAPIVAAGFLNYRRPTFAEVLAGCVADGATEVIVQPYFLVNGKYVRDDVARLIEAGRQAHPGVLLQSAAPFGDHPALARLVLQRALEADYLAANPHITTLGTPRPLDDGAGWRPLHTRQRTGLLIMAHGSPDPHANASIQQVARRARAAGRYAATTICFLDLNKPSIPAAIDRMFERGITHVIAVPYFLHLGSHVAEDLPALIETARAHHPARTILLAEHLGYDRLLLAVIADRVAEVAAPLRRPPAVPVAAAQ
jgi:sirohydrochlorin cobaltochelatase